MDNVVEEIKTRLDIAEIVQEYVRLTRAGTNFKGLCPFHTEKTPSFMVSSDKQIYHCFGCGEGGDVFSFVMKMEGIEFPEALRILAERAGVKIPPRNPKMASQKTKFLDINRVAAAFFNKVLLESSKAQVARDYLKRRQVSDETLDRFQLGYSVEDWDALNNFLMKRGYSVAEIFAAGLTIKKDRGDGYFDRFRGRLMFPLADAHGQIVGFSGRILKAEEKAAKYVNSPQTLIYNKSAVLYALHLAKKVIQKEKLAVVVEGQMDVLASHQAGVENVVASGGTALTQEQVRLIKRYCQVAAFAFDMDVAGAEAARRGLEIAWQNELETRVVQLPFGKDPDECIKKDPAAWPKAIAEARPFMDYYFDKIFKDHDPANVQGKKTAANLFLPLVRRLPNPIEQTHYLQKLAAKINVEERYLRDLMAAVKLTSTTTLEASLPKTADLKDRTQRLAEMVVGIGLCRPEHLEFIIKDVQPEHLKIKEISELYKNLVIYYTENNRFDLKDFYSALAKKDSRQVELSKQLCLLVETEYSELEKDDPAMIKKALIEAIPFLKRQYLYSELKRLEDELRIAEESGNKESIRTLSEHITRLTEELGQLNQ
ncbi:MAG: DNA primase [Patescibacteria group bacterium]|nr:DNA primase [Patescibacteria group bacterium]